MSETPKSGDATAAKIAVEVTPEQAERLDQVFAWSKALGSPARLALVGALAARLGRSLTVAEAAEAIAVPLAYDEADDAPGDAIRAPAGQIERDLQILADARLVQIVEWTADPGREPRIARVAFNPEYLKTAPQVIAALHRVTEQIHPAGRVPPVDERTRALRRLMQNGRLLSWPVPIKQQVWVLEEIIGAFEPRRTYTEREVDAILKDIYAFDHCTLRRALVDLRFMQRENGVYWKADPQPAPRGA